MYRFRHDLEHRKLPVVSVPKRDVMMCLNESAMDPFQAIHEKFLRKMEDIHLNRYFSDVTDELKKALADYVGHGLTPECFEFGNGADEMLYYLFTSIRESFDTHAVSVAPTYGDYITYTRAVGMGTRFTQLDERFDFDENEFLRLMDHPDCRMGILCTPNNPTGNLLDDEKVHRILSSTDKLILIDEAYHEFSGRTYAPFIEKYPNLVIIRTFSKGFGTSGLRFGYMFSSPANMHEIKKVMTFFHMSIMIQAFALTILENREPFLRYNRQIIEDRNRMIDTLNGYEQLHAYPSATNFILFSAGSHAKPLFEYYKENHVAVRMYGSHALLGDKLRVTVSSENDNAIFMNVLQSFWNR